MTLLSSGSGSGSKFSGSEAGINEKTAEARTRCIKNKDGDLVGNNFTIPKADFSAFMGYKPATQGELSGKAQVTGHRGIEVALQKSFNRIGEGAAERGNVCRNMYVANGRFQNEPGGEKDMIKDGLDSIKAGPDANSTRGKSDLKIDTMLSDSQKQYFARMDARQAKSHNDNVRYLEIQYKFQEISKQDGVISNLMKTRHDVKPLKPRADAWRSRAGPRPWRWRGKHPTRPSRWPGPARERAVRQNEAPEPGSCRRAGARAPWPGPPGRWAARGVAALAWASCAPSARAI